VLSCVEAALHAPSAHNRQPWRFVVVDQPPGVQELVRHACRGVYRPTRWIGDAPVIVALVCRRAFVEHRLGPLVQGTPYHLLDMGIAGQHLILRATELGLGSCWIGWFSARGAARALRVPRGHRVVALVVLGWPDPAYVPPPKSIGTVAESVSFGSAHESDGE
jgi:nitroreductase